jgi:hypothetical protein
VRHLQQPLYATLAPTGHDCLPHQVRHLQQPLYATLAPTGRLLTLRSMLDFGRFDELYALRWQVR